MPAVFWRRRAAPPGGPARQDTDGRSIRLHLTLEPQGSVPSAHVHSNLDERFTVLAGALMMRLDREDRTLQAGESVFVPRRTPHQPYNPFPTFRDRNTRFSPATNESSTCSSDTAAMQYRAS